MTVVLPGDLAERLSVAPLSADHLDEVFDILTAHRLEVIGVSRLPKEAVRLTWTSAGQFTILGVRRDGRLVQVWDGELRPGQPSPFAVVTSYPGLLSDADRDALELAGWRYLFGWAAGLVPDPATAEVRTTCFLPDMAGRERRRRVGFTERRVLWFMEASTSAEPPAEHHPPVPGLVVHAAADPRAVHEVFMAGFAGTFDFVDLTFQDFVDSRRGLAGNDPSLWFLATVDDEPAGAMTVNRAAPERGAMQVSELAVLPGFRRRGVGRALLRTAFDTARREGMSLLYLFVDSENDDDAPSVYAAAGFETVQATVQLVRSLVLPGQDAGGPQTG